MDGHAAHYRIRDVKCGKPACRQCPHKRYRYLVWREGGKIRERYLGVVKD